MELKIALLIPVYNESKNISKLIQRLEYPKKDIIIVDDGSTDNTYKIIEKTGVVVLKHNKNLGKGYAQRTGFEYAIKKGYEYVITLDGDGQHNPQEIPLFINRIKETREDIILGERRVSLKTMPIPRYFANLIVSFIVSFFSHQAIRDAQSGYRAISAQVMQKVPLTTSHFEMECEILIRAAKLGYRIGSIPISTIYQQEKSKIKPFIDTVRFIILAFKSIWK
jgi:glycosyltransferase involved in cell wall biosynthesis